jgi:hypothetical protein
MPTMLEAMRATFGVIAALVIVAGLGLGALLLIDAASMIFKRD